MPDREALIGSAKGTKYDSQGQALNNVKRVAPGYESNLELSTEGAK